MRVDSSLQGTNTKTLEGSCRRHSLPLRRISPNPHYAMGETAGKSYSTTPGLVTVLCILISRHRQHPQSLVGPIQGG
jgi:hypothetical protein